MDDAYTIGITLALENGVSDGLAIIRRDLAALDLAIAHTAGGLAELRRASDSAIAGAGLDLARLTSEGQLLLDGLAGATAPTPVRQSTQTGNLAEEARMAPGEAAARQPAPTVTTPSSGQHGSPQFELADMQRPTVPAASVAPLPAVPAVGTSAPAPPESAATPAAMVPPAPPLARDAPARIQVDLAAVNTAPVVPPPAPMRPPIAAPVVPLPQAEPLPGAAPAVPQSPPLQASQAPTVPSPLSIPPSTSIAPVAERPVSPAAAPAPAAVALTVADLSALARGSVFDAVPIASPAPTELSLLGASAAPTPMFGPILLSTYRTDARPAGQMLDTSASGWGTSEPPTGSGGPTALTSAVVPAHSSTPGSLIADTAPRDPARPLDVALRAQPTSSGPEMGNITLDGHQIGHWMSERLAREANRAPTGPTGFDPKLGVIWPGAPILA